MQLGGIFWGFWEAWLVDHGAGFTGADRRASGARRVHLQHSHQCMWEKLLGRSMTLTWRRFWSLLDPFCMSVNFCNYSTGRTRKVFWQLKWQNCSPVLSYCLKWWSCTTVVQYSRYRFVRLPWKLRPKVQHLFDLFSFSIASKWQWFEDRFLSCEVYLCLTLTATVQSQADTSRWNWGDDWQQALEMLSWMERGQVQADELLGLSWNFTNGLVKKQWSGLCCV